jgi:hypothetical protein
MKMKNTSIHTLFQNINLVFLAIAIITPYCIDAATIYARVDGSWSNTNTWSLTGSGGPSCGCTPAASDSVVIDGKEISISTASETVSSLSLTNVVDDHAYLQITNGYNLTVSTNLWARSENYNKNVDLIVDQNGSSVNVQGNVVFERSSSNNQSRYLRLNLSNNSSFTVNGNFTYNYLNSSVAEGNDEILMIDGSVLNIGGNLLIRMDAGNNLVINQSNTSQINVTGNATIDMNGGGDYQHLLVSEAKFYTAGNAVVDIDGGENFVITMSQSSGTEHYKIDGDFSIDKNNAEDFTIDLSNSAELKLGGAFSFTSASASANNSDFTISLANSGKMNISGNTSISMNESLATNCDIIIDMNDDAQFNIGVNDGLLTKSCTLSMTEGEILKLEMDRDASMKVYGNMSFAYTGSDKLQIHLNQNNDGVAADAQLRVDGNFVVNKTDGTDMQIYLDRDSDFDFRKNATITYGNSTGTNAGKITLNNNAGIKVDSNATVTLNCSNQTTNDFIITLKQTSAFKVGPSGGPYTSKSFNVNLTQSRDFEINVNSTAIFTVFGDFNIVKSGARNFTANPSNSGQIIVYNDLDLDNTEDADLLKFKMDGSSIMDVKGNIDLLGAASSGKIELALKNTAALYIGKNFLRNASPNTYGILNGAGSSTVHYKGSSVQQIAKNLGSGTDGFIYQNITINNGFSASPQLSMEGSVVVNGTLTLTDGNVQTTSSNYLEVASGGAISGGSIDSHIIGPLRKTGNSAFTFVVGNGTYFGKIGISAPSSSSTFQAEYSWQTYADLINKDASLVEISSLEYWTLDRVSGSGTSRITLHWDNANNHGIFNTSDLVVCKYNSGLGKWEDLGQSATSGGTGFSSGSVTSNISPSSFSPFAFGSITSSNPLPVELLYFEAEEKNGTVELNWATASEINNRYFSIERSLNAIDFEEITKVEGSGNSSVIIEYMAKDENPLLGTIYYRLKQVDFNGAYSYSDIVPLNIEKIADENIEWIIYPNPVSKYSDLLLESCSFNENIKIQLYDALGQLIYQAYPTNNYKFTISSNILSGFPEGIYHILIQDNNQIRKNRILIIQ